jgi:tyrosine-specific transport protein
MRDNVTQAASSLAGTMVGAGIFGVPFVFAQVGLLASSIMFVFLAAIATLLHLMYGEVVARTKGKHMLIGYADIYFGETAKKFVSVSAILAAYGALIAYLVLVNGFLSTLFGSPSIGFQNGFISEVGWAFVFWFLISLGVIKGMKTIARLEVFLFALLVAIFVVIVGSSLPKIDLENYMHVNLGGIFVAYGVILFSLWGFDAVPEISSSLSLTGKQFKKSIIIGVFAAAILTFLFGVAIAGVSGPNTTHEAIAGIVPFLGTNIVYLGAIFGLVAAATSYLVIAVNLKDSLVYDWRINKILSATLVLAVPMGLVVLGIRDFIQVLGITGAFLGAINSIVIVSLFVRAKKQGQKEPGYAIKPPLWLIIAIVATMVAGGIYAIINLLL